MNNIKNKLIQEVNCLARELGRTPTSVEFDNKYKSIGAVYYHFKSWNNMLKCSNLPIVRDISKEETINRITELSNELGRTPTMDEFVKKYNHSGIDKHFGSYNNLIREAGLKVNQGYSKEELKKILIKQALELGRLPTSVEFAKDIKPKPYIYHYFESWYEFLKYCNIEKELKNKFIDKGSYYKVIVYSNERNEKDFILIDKDKKDLLENKFINWNQEVGATISDFPNPPIRIANVLFGDIDDSMNYIHKNKDNRDYRRKNIDLVDVQERTRRNKLRSDNKTGVKGVTWNNKRQVFQANIGVNGKNIYLGSYNELEDAKKARIEGEKKYWGKAYQE